MKGVPAIFSMLVCFLRNVDADTWISSFNISGDLKYIEDIQLTLPALNHSDIPAWVDEWKAPKSFQKLFPFYISGYDFDGAPVYVLESGRWKVVEAFRSYKDEPEKAFDLFMKYLDQAVYFIYRDGNANNGQGVVIIQDYGGFLISNYASPLGVEAILRQLAILQRLNNVLNYAFIINVNFAADNLIRLARPLLGNILEKCEIFGPQKYKWLPHVVRKIPIHQLPPWYGGPKDWQPVKIGLEPFNSTNVERLDI